MTGQQIPIGRIEEIVNGIPGGGTALVDLCQTRRDYDELLDIVEGLDVGGSAIWVGYKDVCEKDAEEFARKLWDMDEELISAMQEQQERVEGSEGVDA